MNFQKISSQPSADSMVGMPIGEDESILEHETALGRFLSRVKDTPEYSRPVSMGEYTVRVQTLNRLIEHQQAENGFVAPIDINISTARVITGQLSSRMKRREVRDAVDEPISLLREMGLYLLESKPRLPSLALSGYNFSDFFAYIYQDIARNDPDALIANTDAPFSEIVGDIKLWLTMPVEQKFQNTARRHVRRRIGLALDRKLQQVPTLIEDRESSVEAQLFIQKMLERDDDVGYSVGSIRDFRLVRKDFNLLIDHCSRIRYQSKNDEISLGFLKTICCPSEVLNGDFENHIIDRPRGRRALKMRSEELKNSGSSHL